MTAETLAIDPSSLRVVEAAHHEWVERTFGWARLAESGPRHRLAVELHGAFNDPRLYASPPVIDAVRAALGADFVLHAFGSRVVFPDAPVEEPRLLHPPLFPDRAIALPAFALALRLPLDGGKAQLLDYQALDAEPPREGAAPSSTLELVYARPWFLDCVRFGSQPPLLMSEGEYQRIPVEHRPLFARVGSALAQRHSLAR